MTNKSRELGPSWWLRGKNLPAKQDTPATKDPTWCGATKPMYHNYWASALEPGEPQLLKSADPRACALQREKPKQWEVQAPQLERSPY